MEILVESKYLAHEGRTKFYEVVRLYNVAAKRFVSVFRWGKNGYASKGLGEVQVKSFNDIRLCQDVATKKIMDKLRRKASGVYLAESARFGLHAGKSSIDADVLRLRLGEHYGDVEKIDEIVQALGISDDLGMTGVEIGMALKKSEPVRDSNWGSW